MYSSLQPPVTAPRGAFYSQDHPVNEPPWPWSTANSFSDLFSLGRRALHLPRYPLYGPGEERVGDFDYFFLRGERYLSCQAARFLLFGGDFLTLHPKFTPGDRREDSDEFSDELYPYTGDHSLNRFAPPDLRGKHPFTIEINRDLILHNPDNITPTRAIVDRLVQALAQWRRD